jgi:hypothetical protein
MALSIAGSRVATSVVLDATDANRRNRGARAPIGPAPGTPGVTHRSAIMDTETEDGLQIVLSPLQLSAVLQNESIEQSSALTNRFWGGASIVIGAMEMQGAAALLLVPEPTLVTKVGGGALALHGSDTAAAGWVQLITGRTRTTLTAQAASAAARALGADPDAASAVGMAVDLAVPAAAGFAGVARAIAIRRGAVSLAAEEAAGGHTILKHVGRTEEELRARLLKEPKIPAASTFSSLRQAEKVVSDALRANKADIQEWARTAPLGRTKVLTFETGRIIGGGVVRGTTRMQSMTKVEIVLRKALSQNRIYFVLTSYPRPF